MEVGSALREQRKRDRQQHGCEPPGSQIQPGGKRGAQIELAVRRPQLGVSLGGKTGGVGRARRQDQHSDRVSVRSPDDHRADARGQRKADREQDDDAARGRVDRIRRRPRQQPEDETGCCAKHCQSPGRPTTRSPLPAAGGEEIGLHRQIVRQVTSAVHVACPTGDGEDSLTPTPCCRRTTNSAAGTVCSGSAEIRWLTDPPHHRKRHHDQQHHHQSGRQIRQPTWPRPPPSPRPWRSREWPAWPMPRPSPRTRRLRPATPPSQPLPAPAHRSPSSPAPSRTVRPG